MRTAEKDTKLKEALGSELFTELEANIKGIEEGIPITKNHYGKYMAILSKAKTREEQSTLGTLLIYLGGNREGIKSAFQILRSG